MQDLIGIPDSAFRIREILSMRNTLYLAAALSMLACGSRRAPPRPLAEYLTPYGPPTRPFSPAVRVGNLLFLSGQIGVTASGALVPGGIEAETRQTLENIRDVLQRTGSSLDRVVKCTVMLADMREWDAMNTVYTSFFPRNKPARSSFGATGLALGARVEIECIATVD
ncbi:MAG TPA: RidA family protein [Gemmatimonadaceae bacterium]|nr:RidA family protein [Gemmatimonadaceae bacterium]